jgi:hypothetical protein
MQERQACALLKAKFEAAGLRIAENVMFDEAGVRFEIDGFDADARVGYEYVTDEAGDGWDVDDRVQQALADRGAKGELFVLVVTEADAPDADALGRRADAFLAGLPAPAAKKPKPAAKKKPAAEKKPPAARKPPAAKKSAPKR